MRALRQLALVLMLAGVWLIPRPAAAHDGLPVALSIQEVSAQVYLFQLTLPPRLAQDAPPVLTLPEGCTTAQGADRAATSQSRGLYRCSASLAGKTIRFAYRYDAPAVPTLTRVEWLKGDTQSVLSPTGQMRVVVPSPVSATGVLQQYFQLGVEHILEGYDHLLFLACLMLLSGRRILLTVTGFTAGHAVTITAVTLGVVSLPTRAVESVIALSIVFIAAEIARPRRDTLTWRWPVLVSCTFGILHGFGFASALREIGLPQQELPLALLSFNLGIEAGQLVFVVACVILWRWTQILRRRARHIHFLRHRYATLATTYAVGCLAAFWFVQRTFQI